MIYFINPSIEKSKRILEPAIIHELGFFCIFLDNNPRCKFSRMDVSNYWSSIFTAINAVRNLNQALEFKFC